MINEEKRNPDILEDNLNFTGTQINYFFVCKRKLWLFSHHISLENTSDLVLLGKILHNNSYKRESLNELELGRIKIDFIKKNREIHEIKKSRKIEKAHAFQLLYYLYFLREVAKMSNLKGIINYPLLRKTETVILNKEKEKELEIVLKEIKDIVNYIKPPEPDWKTICKKCAYAELCWS